MNMKNMTYRELLDQLKAFRDNDLDLDVMVFVRGMDLAYPVKGIEKTDCDDVLFEGHLFLVV